MALITKPTVRPEEIKASGWTRPQRIGMVLASLGLVLTVATLAANIVAAGDASARAVTLPWAFGLTTAGFGTLKLGIAVVLWGILMNLWARVDSIKDACGRLVQTVGAPIESGTFRTAVGQVTVGESPPKDLPIHSMARRMWAPMLGMGYMAVLIGLVIAAVWAARGGVSAAAWTQGVQFLGEGFLLAGIAFVLGTILWAIRTGGGEVQQGLGVAVKTLKMPVAAKGFVLLMVAGLSVSVVQFALYVAVAAGAVDNSASWLAFLGPLRELGLALILSGIALALVAIGTALKAQFGRVVELLETGK